MAIGGICMKRNHMHSESVNAGSSSSRRRARVQATAAVSWLVATSSCGAERAVHTAASRGAFVPPHMSARHLGRRRSPGVQQPSALSSTPFPAAGGGRRKTTQQTRERRHNATVWSDDDVFPHEGAREKNRRPFPTMPSPLFASLAQSQFELLSHSLVHAPSGAAGPQGATPKTSSLVLYLPKENPNTGQLEFVPAVSHPDTTLDRVFIASESSFGSDGLHRPPTVPAPSGGVMLPGFFQARDLIPSYPFVSSEPGGEDDGDGGERGPFATLSPESRPISVSAVEEIALPNMAPDAGPVTSLSVTLFSGLDTLGVLMVWPLNSSAGDKLHEWQWTPDDKLQVTRAAKSLALALSMDMERASTQLANEQFRVAMADGLHQVKSPLQALRTFGKLLQRQLAEENAGDRRQGPAEMARVPATARGRRQALRLAEDLLSQGERVIGLIEPMDALVQNNEGRYLLQGGDEELSSSALALRPPDASPSHDGNQARADTGENDGQQQHQRQLPPSMPSFGDFKLEMAFPQDILGSIVYASQAIARERGIRFEAFGLEPDNMDLPGVTVCQRHLMEAVSNVLDNAVKYAPLRRKGKVGRPRTPQIQVSLVSNAPPLAPGATLYVEDNGPGIPAADGDRVFERRYRGEAVREAVAGSGLGLAIARELLSGMGGTLEIAAGEGPHELGGTTVRVVLFREREGAAPGAETRAPESRGRR